MRHASARKFVLVEKEEGIRFFVLDTVDVFLPRPSIEIVIKRPAALSDQVKQNYFAILENGQYKAAWAAIPVVYEAKDGQFLQIIAGFQTFDSAYQEFANDIKAGRMIVDSKKGDDTPIIHAKKNDKNQITIDGIVVKSYIDIRQPAMK